MFQFRLHQRYRNYNGFLYIVHGLCRFFFRDESFLLTPGSVVYLPISSAHSMVIESSEIEFYRIDFRLEINGLFSDTPMKPCSTASAELAEAIQTLVDRYQYVQDTVTKTELLCTVFRTLADMTANPAKGKLAPGNTAVA